MAHKVHRDVSPKKKKEKGAIAVIFSVIKDIVTILWILIQLIEHFS